MKLIGKIEGSIIKESKLKFKLFKRVQPKVICIAPSVEHCWCQLLSSVWSVYGIKS